METRHRQGDRRDRPAGLQVSPIRIADSWSPRSSTLKDGDELDEAAVRERAEGRSCLPTRSRNALPPCRAPTFPLLSSGKVDLSRATEGVGCLTPSTGS